MDNTKIGIPTGYQVHITTWENDADNYQTKIISGLTEWDVRFYLAMANRFKSGSNNGMKTLGNHGHDTSVLIEEVKELLKSHTWISFSVRKIWEHAVGNTEIHCEDCDDCPIDCDQNIAGILGDILLGYTCDYEDEKNFCRVFDYARVYFIPSAIIDVTENFK